MGGCDDCQVTDHADHAATTPTAQDEVAALCSDLIRIDTANPGDNSGPGERAAAEHVAAILASAAWSRRSSSPNPPAPAWSPAGRAPTRPGPPSSSTVTSTSSPPTLQDWQKHPLSGEIADGCVWGRGAVDMKDMDAMMLAVLRQRTADGRRPPQRHRLGLPRRRGTGSKSGARFLVDEHRDLFEGVTEAIGEVGGFSTTIGGRPLYPLQTAEKGMA